MCSAKTCSETWPGMHGMCRYAMCAQASQNAATIPRLSSCMYAACLQYSRDIIPSPRCITRPIDLGMFYNVQRLAMSPSTPRLADVRAASVAKGRVRRARDPLGTDVGIEALGTGGNRYGPAGSGRVVVILALVLEIVALYALVKSHCLCIPAAIAVWWRSRSRFHSQSGTRCRGAIRSKNQLLKY
jgi:hypothetical protein